MGKQNKRKSSESIATELPKKDKAIPITQKKEAASAKKVKIDATSPKALKNKPLKTPIKQKTPKTSNKAAETNNTTPQKKKMAGKKAKTNGAAKEKKSPNPKPKCLLIPEEISKKLNRRQRMRITHKISKTLKTQGITDFSKIDPNDESIKEIVNKFFKKENSATKENKSIKTRAKVIKQIVAATAETEVTDDNKIKQAVAKIPKKSPKKK